MNRYFNVWIKFSVIKLRISRKIFTLFKDVERVLCIFVIQSWDKIALSMTWTGLLSSILKHKFNLPSYNFDFQMEENPWQVDSVQAFSFLKCPECIFDTKEEDFFQVHAIEKHPLSFVLFGKTFIENNFEESITIEDDFKKETTCENFDIKNSSYNAFLTEKSEYPFSKEISRDDCSNVLKDKFIVYWG